MSFLGYKNTLISRENRFSKPAAMRHFPQGFGLAGIMFLREQRKENVGKAK
jgi:hypothetical protein